MGEGWLFGAEKVRSMLNLILGIKLGTHIGLNTINRMALGSSRWLIENLGGCERVCEFVCLCAA